MGLQWTSWALPGLLTLVAAWSGAAVLLRTRPDRSLNRRLAFLLFLEGLWLGGAFLFLVEDPSAFWAISTVAVAAMATLPFQYLSFLAAAVPTPLVRPFRSRTAFWLLALGGTGAAGWVLASPSTFIEELYSPSWATWNFLFTDEGSRAAQLHGLASLFGLVAALDAWRRAPAGSAARSRAFWFAVAFGIRDLYAGTSQLLYPIIRTLPFWGDFIYNPGQASIYLVYVLLLAYGVLRSQLFDLDLKVKFALRQGTVGALLTGVFFTIEYVFQRLVAVDDVVLGLVISGGVVLALKPAQYLAQALANGVMSEVDGTPEYIRAQKRSVYRAALEGAMEDGILTPKERSILNRLSEELELPSSMARQLEADVAGD